MSCKTPLAVSAFVLAVCAGSAFGAISVLGDRNSTIAIDDASPAGMHHWAVDGVNHLSQQWFWFRADGDAFERPINMLPLTGAALTDTNPFVDPRPDTLALRYSGAGFSIQPSWTLRGGLPGSRHSDVTEQIVINNTRTTALHLSFFQYSDFNLNGNPFDDSAGIMGSLHNTAQQWDSGYVFSETVVTPIPTHFEVAFFPGIRDRLNDGSITNLLDLAGPIGPGDCTWGFQWDLTIAPGGTAIISKDKSLIPSPGVVGLGVLGLGGLMVWRRR